MYLNRNLKRSQTSLGHKQLQTREFTDQIRKISDENVLATQIIEENVFIKEPERNDKAQSFETTIRHRLSEVKISCLKRTKIIHIKRMVGVVTAEEIKEAIQKKIGADPASYEVKSLELYGNQQNVTIIMPKANAQKLLGSIRVGLIYRIILER